MWIWYSSLTRRSRHDKELRSADSIYVVTHGGDDYGKISRSAKQGVRILFQEKHRNGRGELKKLRYLMA
jgi:hypothetical protein